MPKIIVVGTGFSGTVIARRIAEELGREVTVIERKDHIAGNMYDEMDEHNILVQKYGPHVLVTNEWKVIEYLSRYANMVKHTVKELSFIDGQYVRLPFNFETVQQLLGCAKAETLIRKLREAFPGRDRVPIRELVSHYDSDICDYANMLFEKCYRTYCAKQWNVPTEKLDRSIMDRVPMAMNYDERYMNKDFQYIPRDGFTNMFQNMLSHPNIRLVLACDAMDDLVLDENTHCVFYQGEPVERLVFTGPIDELFRMKYGELPYRSLDIRYEWFDQERLYPETIISYPQADGYTRKTEYKFLMPDRGQARGTVIATEYPVAYRKGGSNAPFYPVITEETRARYERYLHEAQQYRSISLCGRLAEFRYYNMDDCILHAFDVFEELKTDLVQQGKE